MKYRQLRLSRFRDYCRVFFYSCRGVRVEKGNSKKERGDILRGCFHGILSTQKRGNSEKLQSCVALEVILWSLWGHTQNTLKVYHERFDKITKLMSKSESILALTISADLDDGGFCCGSLIPTRIKYLHKQPFPTSNKRIELT